MKRLVFLIRAAAFLAIAGPVGAQTIVCDGLAGGGSGTVSYGGTRDYVYRVTHPNPGTPDSILIGTHDPNQANYTNICMPSGWNVSIVPIARDDYSSLTPHGVVSAGPDGLCPNSVLFESGGLPLPSSPTDFGFDHAGLPHDVDWRVTGTPAGQAAWNAAVGAGAGPVHGPVACNTTCDLPAVIIPYYSLAGNIDNFSNADGPEPAFPSLALQAVLSGCANGPLNTCNPSLNSEFDCPAVDRCFGHTFTGDWDTSRCVVGAELCVHLKATSGITGNDGLVLREDGAFVWGINLGNLQNLANGDPTWDAGDELTYCLDLANLPAGGNGITNVLSLLMDGDLDVYVYDDTEVDYLELTVDVCCQSCFADGDIDGDGIPLAPADMVYLLSFVYGLGPPPIPFCQGDLNGDGYLDHGDLEVIICAMTYGISCFSTYPMPAPCVTDTVRGCCCTATECVVRSPANCAAVGGTYMGDGNYCTGGLTPLIVSHVPAQNALNVAVNANVSVTFDSDMDGATLNSSTFVVQGAQTGLHTGVITYDNPTKTATLDPANDFAVGEVVTVMLTTGIESTLGMALGSSYGWSFTVAVNGGHASFGPAVTYYLGAGHYPIDILAADFDNDLDQDLAIMVSDEAGNADSCIILKNNGNGDMTPYGVYPVDFKGAATGKPASFIALDADNDGDLDLAIVKGDSLRFMENDGSGNMTPHAVHPVGFNGAATGKPSLCAGDMNGDTYLDLIVTNSFGPDGDSVSIIGIDDIWDVIPYGVHPVGFKGGATSKPASCVGDMNNDGLLDVIVTDYDSTWIGLGDGNGDIIAYSVHPVGFKGAASGKPSTRIADMNADSNLDVIVVSSFEAILSPGTYTDTVCIGFGDGSGDIVAYGIHPVSFKGTATGKPASRVADFDGDNGLDVLVGDIFAGVADSLCFMINDGLGEVVAYGIHPVSFKGAATGKPGLVVADFDRDGDLDAAWFNGDTCSVAILFNQVSCDCTDYCDLDGDPNITPVDVSYIVNYVYLGRDARPAMPNCPGDNGDWDCDGSVTPLDVAFYVNYVYKSLGAGPCEPCDCASYPDDCPPYP